MIEAGATEAALGETIALHVNALLQRLGRAPDKAVLGCTHFPLVEALFRKALPAETQILSQPARIAAAMVAYLFRHPEMKDFAPAPVAPLCLTTGDADSVSALASRFLRSASSVPGGRLETARITGDSARCVRSCSIPKPPASTPSAATGWWKSAVSSSSTMCRPARASGATSIRNATCRRQRSRCTASPRSFSPTSRNSPRWRTLCWNLSAILR